MTRKHEELLQALTAAFAEVNSKVDPNCVAVDIRVYGRQLVWLFKTNEPFVGRVDTAPLEALLDVVYKLGLLLPVTLYRP